MGKKKVQFNNLHLLFDQKGDPEVPAAEYRGMAAPSDPFYRNGPTPVRQFLPKNMRK